jgi:squalene-hopene/tetraprenyl-beta-curcumene cyclase
MPSVRLICRHMMGVEMNSDMGRTATLTPNAAGHPAVAAAMEHARTFLDQHRRANGAWAGELSSSALATAIASVALRRHAPTRLASRLCAATEWLAATQREDGGWGDAVTDAGTLNATALAVAALHLEGPSRYQRCIARGRRWIDAVGGFAALNDPERASLSGPCRTVWAMAGLVPWRAIRPLPVEISLLPRPVRRTISTTFPAFLSLAMLHDRHRPVGRLRRPLRRLVERRGMRWLALAQCANGGYEESAFLTSIVAMCLIETPGRAVAERAAAYVERAQRQDGSWPIDRDLETFDSALAIQALAAAGVTMGSPADHALRRWFLETQFTDLCFPTGARPGGWAWAQPGGWPDMDDTSAAIRALLRLGEPAGSKSVQRGLAFMRWMQNRDGSWSTFVKNSPMPFDRACPYITGHALAAFAEAAVGAADPAVRRALTYLERAQRPDGSFEAIWFRNFVAGTASVLEALVLLGLGNGPMARRTAAWLAGAQRPDGGWGGDGGQPSSAEETAWALHALLLQNPTFNAGAAGRAVDWLLDHQRADGVWESAVIGLYYSTLWYSDSMYAVVLPFQALATYQRCMTGGAT